MTYKDELLKTRVERAICLQAQGQFLVDMNGDLPLVKSRDIPGLRYSSARDEYGRSYDFETIWGKFRYDPETFRSLLVLQRGSPPTELLPQPRLEPATAAIHPGYATIHNNGSSFELDFQTRDRVDINTLRLLNQTLTAEQIPLVIWQVDEADEETVHIIRITNDSAMVFASSAIWSTEDQQLVAAHTVTTHQELLKAIKATLANNNSKSYLTLKTQEDSPYLKGARRGFITATSSLVQANAEGIVTALLHPLSGDPQANTAEYFYLAVTPEESLPEKFVERLDLAIPWPLRQEWADYLLQAGRKAHLVEVLSSCGNDFAPGI